MKNVKSQNSKRKSVLTFMPFNFYIYYFKL